MIDPFVQTLRDWQTFYFMIGTASATLIGVDDRPKPPNTAEILIAIGLLIASCCFCYTVTVLATYTRRCLCPLNSRQHERKIVNDYGQCLSVTLFTMLLANSQSSPPGPLSIAWQRGSNTRAFASKISSPTASFADYPRCC